MPGHRPSATPGALRSGLLLALGIGLGVAAVGAVQATGGGARADEVGLAAASGDPLQTPQGLSILGNSCANSDQQPHTGFQEGGRCVATAFGEVGPAEQNPSLLISSAPLVVRVGQSFTIQVSTRNLVRDRFLGAAAGGYYLESSYLNLAGLQRGHFHTACRMLASRRQAPDPAPVPAFFKATEDGGGGSAPDTVSVTVPGLPATGTAQCAVWAGDGSHRIPMMQRANQTPAFDVVRITVLRSRTAPRPAASPTPSAAPSASAPASASAPPTASPAATAEPATDPGSAPSATPETAAASAPSDAGTASP